MLSRVLKRARVALKKLVPKKLSRTPPGSSTYDDNAIEPDKKDSPSEGELDGGDLHLFANFPEDTTYLGSTPNAHDVVHPDVVPSGPSHSHSPEPNPQPVTSRPTFTFTPPDEPHDTSTPNHTHTDTHDDTSPPNSTKKPSSTLFVYNRCYSKSSLCLPLELQSIEDETTLVEPTVICATPSCSSSPDRSTELFSLECTPSRADSIILDDSQDTEEGEEEENVEAFLDPPVKSSSLAPFKYSGFIDHDINHPSTPSSDTDSQIQVRARARAHWRRVGIVIRAAQAFIPSPTNPHTPPSTSKSQNTLNHTLTDDQPLFPLVRHIPRSGSSLSDFTSESSHHPIDDYPSPPTSTCGDEPTREYSEEPWFLVNTTHQKVFLITGTLGSGSFGRVVAAKLMLDLTPADIDSNAIIELEQDFLASRGRTVACAIKVMHKDVVYRHTDGRSAVRSEEKALQRVTMSGVRFLTDVWGTWDDEDNVYFAMPLCNGELGQLCMSTKYLEDSENLRIVFAELLLAIWSLHRLGIMHRDIKPNNILITHDGHVALADFGIAHVEPDITPLFSSSSSYSASPNPEVHLTELAGGTDAYQAPELIQCMHDPDASYTCKVDVWAVGLVMYEMALGLEGPWFTDRGRGMLCRASGGGGRKGEYDATRQLVDTWARILDGEFDWERVEARDSKLADLLKKMLAPNQRTRLSAEQAISHPYFRDLDWNALIKGEVKGPFYPPPEPLQRMKPLTNLSFRTFHARVGYSCVPTVVRKQRNKDEKFPGHHSFWWLGEELYGRDGFVEE